MAITKAPLFSMDASGSLAKSIVFSRWKGRPYVRQLVTPSNPRTGLQTGVRAGMRFLTQSYAGLSDSAKSAWAVLAEVGNVTPLNADVRYNQPRIRENLGVFSDPTNTPGTEPGAPTGVTATAATKSAILDWTTSVTGTPYGTLVHRSLTTGFTPDVSNLIRIVPVAEETYTDIGLTTGVAYFYRLRHTDDAGQLGTAAAEVTATPT